MAITGSEQFLGQSTKISEARAEMLVISGEVRSTHGVSELSISLG